MSTTAATITSTAPTINNPLLCQNCQNCQAPLYKPVTTSTISSTPPTTISASPSTSPKPQPRKNSQSHHEYNQDWSTVTHEKDTWANRERRRGSMWSKVEGYPGVASSASQENERSTSESSGKAGKLGKKGRKGSIFSVFLDDDSSEEEREREEEGKKGGKVREKHRTMRGSILSLWRKGRDEQGRHIIHEGGEERKVEK